MRHQGFGQIVVSSSKARIDRERAPVLCNRLVDVPAPRQQKAQVVVSLGIIGLELECLPILFQGIVDATKARKREPEIVAGLRVVRLERQGLLGVARGFLRRAALDQHAREIVLRHPSFGIAFDCRAVQ